MPGIVYCTLMYIGSRDYITLMYSLFKILFKLVAEILYYMSKLQQ